MTKEWEEQQAGIKQLKEYIRVLEAQIVEQEKDSRELRALYAAGVDNWEGYDYALELMDERDG